MTARMTAQPPPQHPPPPSPPLLSLPCSLSHTWLGGTYKDHKHVWHFVGRSLPFDLAACLAMWIPILLHWPLWSWWLLQVTRLPRSGPAQFPQWGGSRLLNRLSCKLHGSCIFALSLCIA